MSSSFSIIINMKQFFFLMKINFISFSAQLSTSLTCCKWRRKISFWTSHGEMWTSVSSVDGKSRELLRLRKLLFSFKRTFEMTIKTTKLLLPFRNILLWEISITKITLRKFYTRWDTLRKLFHQHQSCFVYQLTTSARCKKLWIPNIQP